MRGGRDSGREISNEDIVVDDSSKHYIILECGYVFCEGWGIGPISFLCHVCRSQPGYCGTGDISLFE